ncbi:uncharacterized protein SPAPADRAFT_66857 [Spathaspora passalidarum NRRL Y-27907]|uniref:Uncharacterized protein n=1 Tax=Spathaspora passalidarum (strain NRRL Y-27907 / 11-Y1) TaxID=619300 RepID=G3APP6_SPAPN|nr:uncharacterized protein SPAPADRAFT_66857 [Spathaspora passalidarum NRRL Y-27907]EGW32217.1 hypothetical protein SPAPADRAFT_66857 [Spathaspora passalidarum NRRL Y-27907]
MSSGEHLTKLDDTASKALSKAPVIRSINQIADDAIAFDPEETLPLIQKGQPILPFKIHELQFTRQGTLIKPTKRTSTIRVTKRTVSGTTTNQVVMYKKPARTLDTYGKGIGEASSCVGTDKSIGDYTIDSEFLIDDYLDGVNILKDDASFEQQLSIGQLSFYPNFNFGAEKSFVVEFPVDSHVAQGAFIVNEDNAKENSNRGLKRKLEEVSQSKLNDSDSIMSLSSELSGADSKTGFHLSKRVSRRKEWIKYIKEKTSDIYDYWKKKMVNVAVNKPNANKAQIVPLYTHKNANLLKNNTISQWDYFIPRRAATVRHPPRVLRFSEPVVKVETMVEEIEPSIRALAENEEVVGALLFITKTFEDKKEELQQTRDVKNEETESEDLSSRAEVESKFDDSVNDCQSFVNDYVGSYIFIDVD